MYHVNINKFMELKFTVCIHTHTHTHTHTDSVIKKDGLNFVRLYFLNYT